MSEAKHAAAAGRLAQCVHEQNKADKRVKRALIAYLKTVPDESMSDTSEIEELHPADCQSIAVTQIRLYDQRKARWFGK